MTTENIKIKAPNFTMIPNVIFDHWMKILSHLQFKILICICRKTLGWHKDKDMLSMNQIAELTNSSKDGVRECLKVLESYGLIKKTISKDSRGDNNPNTYEINIEEEPTKNESFAHLGESNDQGVGDSSAHLAESFAPQKKLKLNKEENIYIPPTDLFTYTSEQSDQSRVFMSLKRYDKLVKRYGKDIVHKFLERLDRYADTNPKKFKDYKCHASVISGWIEKEGILPLKAEEDKAPSLTVSSSLPNEEWARTIGSKFSKVKEMEVGVEGISFSMGQMYEMIKYKEHGFKDRVLNRLRKMNQKVEEL